MAQDNVAREAPPRKAAGAKWAEIQSLDLRHAVDHMPAPFDFVLPGLKKGTLGAMIGAGGLGKSMLMLQAAVTVAGGADTLDLAGLDGGWRSKPGRTLFLTGEDDKHVLAARIHAIGKRLSTAEREAMYENLDAISLVGQGPDMMDQEFHRWLTEKSRNARLVVLDTLRRFHGLDENDGAHMTSVIARMEKLCLEASTTIQFLHHSSKAGARDGADLQQASRGHSVLTDNPRFQANLSEPSREHEQRFAISEADRKWLVRLSLPKTNNSAPIAPRWYRRGEGGVFSHVELKLNQSRKSTWSSTSTSTTALTPKRRENHDVL